jgi:hypothetical protein
MHVCVFFEKLLHYFTVLSGRIPLRGVKCHIISLLLGEKRTLHRREARGPSRLVPKVDILSIQITLYF